MAAEPLVIFPREIAPSLFDAVLASYRAHGVTPHIGQRRSRCRPSSTSGLGRHGRAWVPESVTRLQRPGVAYRAVSGAALRCETSLVWREPGAPVVQRFVEHVLAQVGEA